MKLLAKARTTGGIEAEFKLPVMVTKLLINDIYQNLMISCNKPVNWIINCTSKSSTKYRSILFHLIHHSRGMAKTSRWYWTCVLCAQQNWWTFSPFTCILNWSQFSSQFSFKIHDKNYYAKTKFTRCTYNEIVVLSIRTFAENSDTSCFC